MKKPLLSSSLFAATLAGGMMFSTQAYAGDKRCDGMDAQIAKISDAVDKACKATEAGACDKINSPKSQEFIQTVKEFVSAWNQFVGNSNLKIGPRMFDLGSGGSGTIQSTQRMWVSKGISTGDTVTIELSELDGKLFVGAHLCLLAPGEDDPVYAKTITFNDNNASKGKTKESKSLTVSGAKGKIVMLKIAAQKASANKFEYKFTSSSK